MQPGVHQYSGLVPSHSRWTFRPFFLTPNGFSTRPDRGLHILQHVFRSPRSASTRGRIGMVGAQPLDPGKGSVCVRRAGDRHLGQASSLRLSSARPSSGPIGRGDLSVNDQHARPSEGMFPGLRCRATLAARASG
ncbi:hypothetical protein CPLU01_12385 [Colletotrichum plurivorum]|uniref:Uncharacterized protein n=1 Tax=Colletotrichum plurivorum TaxID=2175906 RepID=A0A8H6JYI1_9PEZI|nr:hypothetical protein CPLU01_12385 [Colletotrichum plurivorum]